VGLYSKKLAGTLAGPKALFAYWLIWHWVRIYKRTEAGFVIRFQSEVWIASTAGWSQSRWHKSTVRAFIRTLYT